MIRWGAVIVRCLLACLAVLVVVAIDGVVACAIIQIYTAVKNKKIKKENLKQRENNLIYLNRLENEQSRKPKPARQNVYQKTRDLRRGYTAILDYDQYKRVNEITLCKDGVAVKKIVQNGGDIADYPNNPQHLGHLTYKETYMSWMKDDDTFCFAYLKDVIQNYGDGDGFGVEPDEDIIAYAILNGKGEYLTNFTYREPEGYVVF